MNLRVMALKGYFTHIRSSKLEPHYQMQFSGIPRSSLKVGVLFLCIGYSRAILNLTYRTGKSFMYACIINFPSIYNALILASLLSTIPVTCSQPQKQIFNKFYFFMLQTLKCGDAEKSAMSKKGFRFGWLVSFFNGLSTFVGYLMPRPFS